MTAEEIRAECEKNVDRINRLDKDPREYVLTMMQYGALMEIAAQLAELNVNVRKSNLIQNEILSHAPVE